MSNQVLKLTQELMDEVRQKLWHDLAQVLEFWFDINHGLRGINRGMI